VCHRGLARSGWRCMVAAAIAKRVRRRTLTGAAYAHREDWPAGALLTTLPLPYLSADSLGRFPDAAHGTSTSVCSTACR
jgi:hypothetical protein